MKSPWVIFAVLFVATLLTIGLFLSYRPALAQPGIIQANGSSHTPGISSDGRYIVFNSIASNLVSGDTNGLYDVFVRDRDTGVTERISVATDGTQANGFSASYSISDNGRYVAFYSDADNLVSGDTNSGEDVFVHDRNTGVTERISVATDGTQANDNSLNSVISADGRYITFYSYASNLVSNDTNNMSDVFVHDRNTGVTERISVATGGTQANGNSYVYDISADGRYITIYSYASNLVSNDTNNMSDVFVHDRDTGVTERISVATGGTQVNGNSSYAVISADGRFVAFYSYASNLVSNDTNNQEDIFVHDRQTDVTERVSVASDGTEADGYSANPSISTDGRYVVFYSYATNLVVSDTNEASDVFVHDRQTDTTERISVGSSTQADAGSGSSLASVSSDGRHVVFWSDATNLVSDDTNGYRDIFVHDRQTGTTERVSIATSVLDDTPPAAITDLHSNPSSSINTIVFTWTAPGDDGSDGGSAVSYDLRYSSNPITEENWDSATPLNGEPTPDSPGSSEWWLQCCFSPGTRRYFAIKAVDDAGNWSEISNIPSLQDTGFRPVVWGYQFSNSDPRWGTYPDSPADGDFTIEDMQTMFGPEAVCHTIQPNCEPVFPAREWHEWINSAMSRAGHCDGFATTSLRFFGSPGDLDEFQDGASVTHDLELQNIRRHIAYNFALLGSNPVAEALTQTLQLTSTNQILDQLRSAMSTGVSDPTNFTTLLVYKNRRIGHTITPYALQERGNGIWWIWVYDNNHPDDGNRQVEVNIIDNTWHYDTGQDIYIGDSSTQSLGAALGAIPIEVYNEQPECPWCRGTSELNALEVGHTQTVWLAGTAHLLLTNSQGLRLGYIGSQYISEIPEAFGSTLPGGLGISVEPIYYLPISDTYRILLDGQTLTQTETASISQFGPGYAVSIDGVEMTPTSQSNVMFAPDGKQVTYQPNDSQDVALTLALDTTTDSYQFQIKNADIGASHVVTMTVDLDNNRVVFNNAQASGGTYDLEIECINGAGATAFAHADIDILETDTHFLYYDPSDCSGTLTLEIDHGSDGTIDEALELENQAGNTIYLPIILK